ncbi:hypothetical protein BC828DRAFT_393443 [Blastocladiella britannica]|nr:hypothetical protein BC828DRAFT_393443 [Blastocladiella britannica]
MSLPTFTLPTLVLPTKTSATPTATDMSSTTASKTDSTSASATATPTEDPCQDGRCQPPGKSQDCLVINKAWNFRRFTPTAYLPIDLRAYFKDRFPLSYPGSNFPAEMRNASDLVNLWGVESWSLFSTKFDEYSTNQAGCQLLRQRWMQTWNLVDLYQYYQSKGDPCSGSGPILNVCAATFDERADSVAMDWNNATFCNGATEQRKLGTDYVTKLRTHPYRSDGPGCVSGNDVEGELNKCGYYTESGACLMASTCPNLDPAVVAVCPQRLAGLSKLINPSGKVDGSGSSSSNSGLTTIVVAAVVVVALVGGLIALISTRRKSGGIIQTLGRTMARVTTLGRNNTAGRAAAANAAAAGSNGGNGGASVAVPAVPMAMHNAPPPPQGMPMSGSATPVGYASTEFGYASKDANGQPILMAHQDNTGASSSVHGSPMVGASASTLLATPLAYNPRASIISQHSGAVHVDPATGALMAYVDQYGNPVDPAAVYAAASIMSPSSAHGSAPGSAVPSPMHMASPAPGSVPMVDSLGQPIYAPDGSHAMMMPSTTVVQEQHVQEHHQQFTSTTTAAEQFVYYVDEQGNPVDEHGNPLPAGHANAIPPGLVPSSSPAPQ